MMFLVSAAKPTTNLGRLIFWLAMKDKISIFFSSSKLKSSNPSFFIFS
jgi:hypothetical protein